MSPLSEPRGRQTAAQKLKNPAQMGTEPKLRTEEKKETEKIDDRLPETRAVISDRLTAMVRLATALGLVFLFAALAIFNGCGGDNSSDKKLYRGKPLEYYIALLNREDDKMLLRRGIKYIRAFDADGVKALPRLVELLFYEDVNIATHAANTISALSNFEITYPELRKFEAELRNAQENAPPVMYKSLQITLDRIEGKPTFPIPAEGRLGNDSLDSDDSEP
jgi:hypothetical protein